MENKMTSNSTTQKEEPWVYLFFFLIGIVSFPIGFFFGRLLSPSVQIEGIWQLILFPLLICSILFAVGLYAFKERSFIFVLKAFAISLVASSLIFLAGFFGVSLFSGGTAVASLSTLLLLLILSAIGLSAFRKKPLVYFSIKAFIASFVTIFFIFGAVLGLISFISLFFFFGPHQDSSTSASIYLESSAEKLTIYVPVLLDENKKVLKMYEKPTITGNVTTAVIDTEYGKALMISRSGLGNYLFDWNEVPGKDTDRFVKWLENRGMTQPGEKLDIRKTDNDSTLTVSGGIGYKYRINEKKVLELINTAIGDTGLFFAKEENGKLNIYAGNNEIDLKETHGKLKEDEQTSDEFFRGFTISMSSYTSSEPQPKIDAWVYSDTEIEKVRFYFYLDPANRINRRALSIGTDGWVHLKKGWQVVNLSGGIVAWD